ncbi:MAG: hypothetical protein ABGW69_02400 [Nanoarchaeota archaeon]
MSLIEKIRDFPIFEEEELKLVINFSREVNNLYFDYLSVFSNPEQLLEMNGNKLNKFIEEVKKKLEKIKKYTSKIENESNILRKLEDSFKSFGIDTYSGFKVKPFESVAEKLIRASLKTSLEQINGSSEEAYVFTDLIRAKVTIGSSLREGLIFLEKTKDNIITLTEKHPNIAMVYNRSFKVYTEKEEANFEGWTLENKEGNNIYIYKLNFPDENEAWLYYKNLKEKLKESNRVIDKYTFKLSDKCFIESFKGELITFAFNEDKSSVYIVIGNEKNKEYIKELSSQLRNNQVEIEKRNIIEINKNLFIKRPHVALNKVEAKTLFPLLGITPEKYWMFNAMAFEEKEAYLSKNYGRENRNFYNLNFAVGNCEGCSAFFYPIGEIQFIPNYLINAEKFDDSYSHSTYEIKRIQKIPHYLNKILDFISNKYQLNNSERRKLAGKMLKLLRPLLDSSIYRKKFDNKQLRLKYLENKFTLN